MDFFTLRNLVRNGWTIANRKALRKVVGKNEFGKLCEAYQRLETYHCDVPSLANTGHKIFIPCGDIELKQRCGKLKLEFPGSINNLYTRYNIHVFEDKDINVRTITKQLRDFEARLVNRFKNAKELPESALESKTMKKLYSSEFKPTRRANEDGMAVTTIIDKTTGKPVEAYVKPIKIDYLHRREHYGLYVKDSNGEYELLGERIFGIDKANNKISTGWMDSKKGFTRYEGIGLRLHQIAVERMMQENLGTVEICALDTAFPFHYKSGFRAVPEWFEFSEDRIDRAINSLVKESGIPREQFEKALVMKQVDGKLMLQYQTMENFGKLLYLKNDGHNYCLGEGTPMNLRGEWLEKWKQMAQSQPILLKSSS